MCWTQKFSFSCDLVILDLKLQLACHVVFSGLDNASKTINKACIHLDNKEKIEQYGLKMSDKINFTSFRLPMFYQAITSSTIKKLTPNEFLLTLLMGDKPVYSNSEKIFV